MRSHNRVGSLIRGIGSRLFGEGIKSLAPYLGGVIQKTLQLGNKIGLPTHWTEKLTNQALEGLHNVTRDISMYQQGGRGEDYSLDYGMHQQFYLPGTDMGDDNLGPDPWVYTGWGNLQRGVTNAAQVRTRIEDPRTVREEDTLLRKSQLSPYITSHLSGNPLSPSSPFGSGTGYRESKKMRQSQIKHQLGQADDPKYLLDIVNKINNSKLDDLSDIDFSSRSKSGIYELPQIRSHINENYGIFSGVNDDYDNDILQMESLNFDEAHDPFIGMSRHYSLPQLRSINAPIDPFMGMSQYYSRSKPGSIKILPESSSKSRSGSNKRQKEKSKSRSRIRPKNKSRKGYIDEEDYEFPNVI